MAFNVDEHTERANEHAEMAPGQEQAQEQAQERAQQAPLPSDAAVSGRAKPGRKRQPPRGDADDAFASADSSALREASLRNRQDRRKVHRKAGILTALLVIVFLLSSTLGVTFIVWYPPSVLVDVLGMWVQVTADAITNNPEALNTVEVMAICPEYYEVTTRIGISFQTILCGGLLALAGSLYQMVFRNPIAAPTMLGVSNGISLGILVLVLQFTYQAPYLFGLKYAYCYIGAIAVLLVVLFVSWLASGRKRISIVELLLIGALFSQILGAVVGFISDMFMDDDLWLIYQEVSDAMAVNTEWYSYVVLTVSFLVAVVPVFLMRYSINAVNYSEDEARLAGINSNQLKVLCLVFSTIMVIVAQVHCGQIAMISLVIPFVSRALFGTEFRGQFIGDLLIGALLLLVCRDIVSCIPFAGEGVPIGTVVSFVTMPIYMFLLAKRQRGWD